MYLAVFCGATKGGKSKQEAIRTGFPVVVIVNRAIITLKQMGCRCPTVGAAAPPVHGGRRAGA